MAGERPKRLTHIGSISKHACNTLLGTALLISSLEASCLADAIDALLGDE